MVQPIIEHQTENDAVCTTPEHLVPDDAYWEQEEAEG